MRLGFYLDLGRFRDLPGSGVIQFLLLGLGGGTAGARGGGSHRWVLGHLLRHQLPPLSETLRLGLPADGGSRVIQG